MSHAWMPRAPIGPLLGFGQVRHARLKPQAHAFAYPTYFLMLPMRHLQAHGGGALALNRRAALSFHDADHGDGRSAAEGGALGWLLDLLAHEGIDDADGEVWLHCYPRVLGCAFKPVSFWYCHRADHRLRAIVVEVNNTFGERHCCLLRGEHVQWGQSLQADKVFHVSPFCAVRGQYRFCALAGIDTGDAVHFAGGTRPNLFKYAAAFFARRNGEAGIAEKLCAVEGQRFPLRGNVCGQFGDAIIRRFHGVATHSLSK